MTELFTINGMAATETERVLAVALQAAEARVAAGLQLASQLESEADYYKDRRVDVGSTARRIRSALGLKETA